jgi:hypothetical protein
MNLRGWRLPAALTVIAVGLVVTGWVLFSDDTTIPVAVESGVTTVERATTSTVSSTSTSTTSTTSTTTSTTTTTTSTVPPTTRPAPPPPPTAPPPPLSVAVTGDSMSRGILTPIRAALQSDRTQVDHQGAGGFLIEETRVALAERLRTNPPDVFVMLLATWENGALQSGEVLNPADPAWPELYRRDYLQPWVDQAGAAGSEIIWVGMPLTRHAPTSAQNQQLNAIWREVAAREPHVFWVDGPGILAGPDGGYLEIDSSVSPPQRLFNLDGLHLCQEASLRLTEPVLGLLADRYGALTNPGWRDTDWRSDPEAYKPGECPAPG